MLFIYSMEKGKILDQWTSVETSTFNAEVHDVKPVNLIILSHLVIVFF